MYNRSKKESIRWKVQAVNILTSLLTVVVGCIIVYNTIILPDRQELHISIANNLAYSADTLGQHLTSAVTLCNLLYSDDVLQKELADLYQAPNSYISLQAKSDISNVLLHYKEQYSKLKIKYISVVAKNFSYSTNDGVFSAEKAETVTTLQNLAQAGDGALMFYVLSEGTETRLYMTRIIRQIKGLTLNHLGCVTICIDMDALISSTTSFASTFGNTKFLLLQGNQILYRDKELENICEDDCKTIPENGYAIVYADECPYFGVEGKIPFCSANIQNWHYYAVASYENILHEMHKSLSLSLVYSLLLIVFSFLFSSKLMAPIFREITHLIQRMKSFDGVTSPCPANTYILRNDEIAELHHQFENMGKRIAKLIQENYEKELLQKATELHALMMQVNPHFLYNVLESINWQASSVGLNSVCEMSSELGQLLRETIGDGRQLVSLREELSIVSHFVTIQRIRFEDRMDYQEKVDASLYDVSVPRLVIQPLIDNAIQYGLEDQIDDKCLICLSIYENNDANVEICVKNTGSIFETNLLDRLRSKEIKPRGTGIGLLNIDTRLRLLYNNRYQFQLYNDETWAIVKIILPVNRGEKSYVQANHC